MNVLLLGYYGFHNLGDDLMLEGLTELLSHDSSVEKILVPVREYYYPKMQLVKYVALPTSLVGWMNLMRCSHRIVWGGGTCLYANSGLVWLFLMSFLARLLGKKFSFLSIGVEAAAKRKDAFLIRMILRMAHVVSIREEDSVRIVRKVYGIESKKVILSYDLASLSVKKLIRQKCKRDSSLNRVSFSGHYAFVSKAHIEYCAQLLTKLLERHPNLTVHFLPAHEGYSTDDIQHRIIASYIPTHYRQRLYFYQNMSLTQYIEQMTTMNFHIGFRLHSVFIAEYLNLPYLALAYAPKVRVFAQEHRRYSVPVGEAVPPDIVEQIFRNFSPCEVDDQQLDYQLNNIKECVRKVLH